MTIHSFLKHGALAAALVAALAAPAHAAPAKAAAKGKPAAAAKAKPAAKTAAKPAAKTAKKKAEKPAAKTAVAKKKTEKTKNAAKTAAKPVHSARAPAASAAPAATLASAPEAAASVAPAPKLVTFAPEVVASAPEAAASAAKDAAPAPEAPLAASSAQEHAFQMVLGAVQLLGTPYRFGGKSAKTGLDCSGFVSAVVAQATGLELPGSAREQARATRRVKLSELSVGDLLFFNTRGRPYSHVGIYMGDGRFIHAPRTGSVVRMEDMGKAYWTKRLTSVHRLPLHFAAQ